MSILDEEGQRQTQPRFLDLSGVHISSKEELQNIMFKMLEVRLRPDKLSDDEINRIIFCESTSPTAPYPFLDPIPASMREVDLSELSQVDIDWKMLTLARPNTKQEMEIFSRFVELEKLKVKSLFQEDVKAEARVTAIKIKIEADGFEQETNSDEFTYEYFSRRHAAEEIQAAEDTSKKPAEEEKRKLSQKLDSLMRQETILEPVESPSPIPDLEPETKGKLSIKKKKKKKKLRKNKSRRRRKRRIKRLKNGKVVFVTVKRRTKWYTLKKKKRRDKKKKDTSTSKEQPENVVTPAKSESTTGEEAIANGSISNEVKVSEDVSGTKNGEIKQKSVKLRKVGKNKEPTKTTIKAPKVDEEGVKTRKNNLTNASKTEEGHRKLVGRYKNTTKNIKGLSSRALAKRGTFARSTSIRLSKNVKVTRQKRTRTSLTKKESTNAKLDADGKGIESDEIGKEEHATEEKVSSAKLSSARGKMKVKNRRTFKTLIRANMDSKRTPKSPSEKSPGEEDSKKNINDKGAST